SADAAFLTSVESVLIFSGVERGEHGSSVALAGEGVQLFRIHSRDSAEQEDGALRVSWILPLRHFDQRWKRLRFQMCQRLRIPVACETREQHQPLVAVRPDG